MYVCTCGYICIHTHTHTHLLKLGDGCMGSFSVLAIVNSVAMNIGVHGSFQGRVFIFCGFTPRSGTAGSYGNSIFTFFSGTSVLFYIVATPAV